MDNNAMLLQLIQNQQTFIHNQQTSINNLEAQMGRLLSMVQPGTLPGNTDEIPKGGFVELKSITSYEDINEEEAEKNDAVNDIEDEAKGDEEELLQPPIDRGVSKVSKEVKVSTKKGATCSSKPVLAPYKPKVPYPNRLDEDPRAK